MKQPASSAASLWGVACGAGAALFWAAGFAAARHGVALGFSPADLALHRFAWAGLFFLPVLARPGLRGLGGIAWTRCIALTLFGGPPLAIISYVGFLSAPLGHGGIIQPSSATLFGLLFSSLVLGEWLPIQRLAGALVIVAGVVLIGIEALATIGRHGLLGDLAFASAGLCFAIFAALLRIWRVPPVTAMAVVSVVSLADIPIHWVLFGFSRMAELGAWNNVLQLAAQGILAGPGALYLFARAVGLLGPARAAVFTSLVPAFTLLMGYLFIGENPSAVQLLGLVIVLVGFRVTQKA